VRRNEHSLPIFPLANVVLFPRVRTPLHIFEPRYRQMAEHALAGDRRIAMAVVRPDRVDAMAGEPPVFPVACAGVIRESRRLADGRYHIVLHGTQRVRILEEPERPRGQLYRVARVTAFPDACGPDDAERVGAMRPQVVELVRAIFGGEGSEITAEPFREIDDTAFVNALCVALPLSTPEKQGLLEADGIPARFERLIDVLRFALAERGARRVPNSGTFH
jgi:Lon protease-like protein